MVATVDQLEKEALERQGAMLRARNWVYENFPISTSTTEEQLDQMYQRLLVEVENELTREEQEFALSIWGWRVESWTLKQPL